MHDVSVVLAGAFVDGFSSSCHEGGCCEASFIDYIRDITSSSGDKMSSVCDNLN